LHNEALDTRDYENRDRFTYLEIERRKDPNKNDLVYPTIDWTDMLTKNYTTNQRINANVSGGGKKIKYYVAGSLTQDNGILKVDNNSNFNSNIDLKKFLLRTNVNIDLTSTAKLNIRMHGTFDDYTGPMTGGSEVYVNTLKTSPVLFPATFERDVRHQYVDHTLFGNYYSNGKLMQNPYANMVKGYKEYQRTTFLTQLEYEQDLNFITEGLHFKMLANTSRYSFFNATRQYKPFYYQVATYNKSADTYNLMAINDGESNNGVTKGDESLEYADNGGDKDITSSYYLENSLRYNRTFLEKHSVGATLVAIFREFQVSNPKGDNGADRLQASLPSRNLGVSGRVEYSYDGTYFGEFNFGYNGSERFDGQNRYGFFPAFGGGIVISNYDFWKPIKKSVNLLKLKTTYGLVGNDQIGSANDRFFYLSSVSVANSGSFKFGRNRAESMPLTKVNRYANPKITWEIAYKANYGIELGLFDKFTLQADFFTERRTNILMSRADIPLSMGLEVIPQANVGEAKSFGFDASVDYKQFFSNDFWITARGNFTFARNEITKIEEPDYNAIGAPWKSRVGYSASQKWGYVAERLFVNDAEAENSAPQHVGNGDYGGGDIKYKDINKDGKIDEFDQVPIGHPTTPEIIYGFGASLGYKDFDFSFFFQGSALSSFRIDYNKMNPFVENKGWMTGLTEFIADDYYSEEFPNTSAEWPRLSPYNVSNNSANSTFFLRDGAFIRLKSVELGYNIPESLSKQIAIKNARFYLSGSNLLTWSKFDLWDVEMGGDGLGYPIQRVFNLGLQVTF
jgi:TonB-linked SusC/RagA family outer membrane protein